MHQVICWFVYVGNWFVYIGKNPRFTAFLNSNLHTRLAIVTENELGLAFPPRDLPKKFRPAPSTFYLVIVVTNKQTDRQTYAGDYIIPRESFRGDKNTGCQPLQWPLVNSDRWWIQTMICNCSSTFWAYLFNNKVSGLCTLTTSFYVTTEIIYCVQSTSRNFYTKVYILQQNSVCSNSWQLFLDKLTSLLMVTTSYNNKHYNVSTKNKQSTCFRGPKQTSI